MNIVLLGASGQLGRSLLDFAHYALPPKTRLNAYALPSLDVTSTSHLLDVLDRHQADVIINAAAYTAVDKAEIDKEKSYKINALAVSEMAKWAKKKGALLCHYSSDYVMGGKGNLPISEEEKLDPLNVYGWTKAEAERLIQESGCRFLILRTSWLYSPYRQNFLKTILKALQQTAPLYIVNDQYGVPTSASFVAKHTFSLLEKEGIYHVVPQGECSWYAYAQEIKKQYLAIHPMAVLADIHEISTEDYAALKSAVQFAKRPPYSVLSSQRLQACLSRPLPTWQALLEKTLPCLL